MTRILLWLWTIGGAGEGLWFAVQVVFPNLAGYWLSMAFNAALALLWGIPAILGWLRVFAFRRSVKRAAAE